MDIESHRRGKLRKKENHTQDILWLRIRKCGDQKKIVRKERKLWFRQEGLYWEKNISKYRRGDTMIETLHPLDPAILFVDSTPSPPLTQTLC